MRSAPDPWASTHASLSVWGNTCSTCVSCRNAGSLCPRARSSVSRTARYSRAGKVETLRGLPRIGGHQASPDRAGSAPSAWTGLPSSRERPYEHLAVAARTLPPDKASENEAAQHPDSVGEPGSRLPAARSLVKEREQQRIGGGTLQHIQSGQRAVTRSSSSAAARDHGVVIARSRASAWPMPRRKPRGFIPRPRSSRRCPSAARSGRRPSGSRGRTVREPSSSSVPSARAKMVFQRSPESRSNSSCSSGGTCMNTKLRDQSDGPSGTPVD